MTRARGRKSSKLSSSVPPAAATSIPSNTDTDTETWEQRVRALEEEGLTRSDAQAVVDAEDQRKTPGGTK
jgi:phage baseplate assembly protein W